MRMGLRGLLLSSFFVAVLAVEPVLAQGEIDRNHVPSRERVDALERRRDDVDGNNIRATITNWLQTAQSGSPGDFWYEWPKNTNRIYIALTQLWVGAEVTANAGPQRGERMWIVNVSDFRNNQEGRSTSWTFEPVKGYVNPAGRDFGIAQSDEPSSWPPFWPDKLPDQVDPGWRGSWNGFFGKDIRNADQEFFFKAGDDQYDRYRSAYRPDSTDLTRHGLGLIIENRIMAWSQVLINDVVFLIFGVTNDGTEDLSKVAFSMWLADCVGGTCSTDQPFYDILEDTAFMTDATGRGDQHFGTDPTGIAAFSFLETPGNAVDRIDNDGDGTSRRWDGRQGSFRVITADMLVGEDPTSGVDDNGNGLIDENRTHIAFADQTGVGYADGIDHFGTAEEGSPVITQAMIDAASTDRWRRWPPNPENDPMQTGLDGRPIVHLIGVQQEDLGKAYKDNVDNDNSCIEPSVRFPYLSEPGSPMVTQAMIDEAANDPYRRWRVPGTDIILYSLGPEDLGKCYADGIDNDGDGAVDEGIDEGINDMIDESRCDFIDNDYDWNPLRDDTGIDGVHGTGAFGEGDGLPTSGCGTPFPGERNIDKTDVSESDQIGITNVRIIPAFSLNFNSQSDRFLFNTFMVPGRFDTEKPEPGDNDLVITSSLFPLEAGQTERISLAIQIGQTMEEVLRSRDNALSAYEEDYQFAQAPNIPTATAVPGDGRVTLYWDSIAEESIDPFLESLGLPAKDFEGYRIYRATDPAFLDPLTITDGFGNLIYRRPIAQFDLANGIRGFHPIDVNGVKFFLGNDTGLSHTFVDSTVTNGIRYFYAVTAYDHGAAVADIAPTETPIRIRRLPDGTIQTGSNVVVVTPTPPVAGYENAVLENVNGFLPRVQGNTSSRIGYEVIDPRLIQDGRRYRVVFEDTLISGGVFSPDTLRTKNFSLLDVDANRTLLSRSGAFRPGNEFPVLDDTGDPIGFRLLFFGEPRISVNTSETGWNDPNVFPVAFDPYLAAGFVRGLRNPADYEVEVIGPGEGRSVELQVRRNVTLPSRPTNVRVFRLEPDGQGGVSRIPVDYGFWDLTGPDFISATSTEPATFSADPARGESDRIILFEPKVGDPSGQKIITWQISLNFTFRERQNPSAGDLARIVTRKPFLSTDVFEFTARGPTVNTSNPDSLLARIQVVPNPYVAANRFETQNPFATGRGPRVIKFMNLPPEATVRIFSVSGRLVRELRLNRGSNTGVTAADLLNGTLDWDLQSSDNLTVSYGMYLYHVEAPGIGEKTGTFAIIK